MKAYNKPELEIIAFRVKERLAADINVPGNNDTWDDEPERPGDVLSGEVPT